MRLALITASSRSVSIAMNKGGNTMGCGRAILCIIFPPLAVIDRGCGTVIIVLLLTLAGWIPGAIAALILNYIAANKPKDTVVVIEQQKPPTL
jgi:uncharacterized membrane protein YqaE (UPF0057 family)